MKNIYLLVLLPVILISAETNRLQVATVTKQYGSAKGTTTIISNVTEVVKCTDGTCTNLVYLWKGQRKVFHTKSMYSFELKPQ